MKKMVWDGKDVDCDPETIREELRRILSRARDKAEFLKKNPLEQQEILAARAAKQKEYREKSKANNRQALPSAVIVKETGEKKVGKKDKKMGGKRDKKKRGKKKNKKGGRKEKIKSKTIVVSSDDDMNSSTSVSEHGESRGISESSDSD